MEEEERSAAQMRMMELLERHRPKRFEEVLGQDDLVSTLARRVITKDHSWHIVLNGPEGSGKLTVARLYAKALQCDEPTHTRSACHRCEPCRLWGPSLNYIEVDAKICGNVECARPALPRSSSGGFDCRTVCHCGHKCRQVKQFCGGHVAQGCGRAIAHDDVYFCSS